MPVIVQSHVRSESVFTPGAMRVSFAEMFIKLRNHAGLTLIEAVLAILILASCIIGVATLYTRQENIARGGRLHERAVELARELAKQISDDSDSKHNYETVLGISCDTATTASTAENRVACWQDKVEQELTDGSARVSLDRTLLPAQYVIIVSWSEPRSGTASYVLRVTPAEKQAPGASPVTKQDATRVAD